MDFNPIKKGLQPQKMQHIVKKIEPKFLVQQEERQVPIPPKSGMVHLQRKQNNRDLQKVNKKIFLPSNSDSKEDNLYEGGEEDPPAHFKSVQEPNTKDLLKQESTTSQSPAPSNPPKPTDPDSVPTEEDSREINNTQSQLMLPTENEVADLEQQQPVAIREEAYNTVTSLINPHTDPSESNFDTNSYQQSYVQKSQGEQSNKTVKEFLKLKAQQAQNDKEQEKILDQLKSLQDIESSITFITGIE